MWRSSPGGRVGFLHSCPIRLFWKPANPKTGNLTALSHLVIPMHVEILAQNCTVRSRSFRSKDGKDMTVHEQPAYLWMTGAPYPLPFTLPIDNPSAAYSPGEYVFGPGAVRTNNFGQIEFNRFGLELQRANVKRDQPKAVNS